MFHIIGSYFLCAFTIVVSIIKVYACDLLNKNKTPNEDFPPESMPTHSRDGLPLIRQVASQFFDISSKVFVVSFFKVAVNVGHAKSSSLIESS